MSSISSYDIISIVLSCEVESGGWWPDPETFLCVPASTADTAPVNPNGIKTLLANGLIIFSLMAILFLVMDQEIYQEILLIVSY